MKVLVVGAGYVGLPLIGHLQKRGHEVFATTTDAAKADLIKAYAKRVFLLDPTSEQSFDDALEAADAAVVLVAPKHSRSYEETYLKTAKRIASSLKRRTRPLYLVYSSSTSVYEGIQKAVASEDLELSPESENGKVLLETEKVLLAASEACVLRLGGIYGPGRELSKRAGYFSGKALPGIGAEPTNHIHLDDILGAIDFCLERGLTGTYNLVNHDHPTRKALYTRLCQEESLPPPHWNPELQGERRGYLVSNQKILEAGYCFSKPRLNLP